MNCCERCLHLVRLKTSTEIYVEDVSRVVRPSQLTIHFRKHQRRENKVPHIISQFEQCYIAEVEDIIISLPHHEPNAKLWTELLKRLAPLKQQCWYQFLTLEMGDSKPSQFLRHLRSLAPDMPDLHLRTIWFSRLPIKMQTSHTCTTTTSAPHHTTTPAHGPPQASSSNSPRQTRYLHTQGSHQLHTRLPPTGLNSTGPQTFLQRPLSGLVSERQNVKTPCVWKTHHRVCLVTYSMRTTADTLSRNLLPPQPQHRLQRPRLHASDAMSIFPLCFTS
jgi:hypothetical protein